MTRVIDRWRKKVHIVTKLTLKSDEGYGIRGEKFIGARLGCPGKGGQREEQNAG